MQIDKSGCVLTREELRALLAFAGKDLARRHYACVVLEAAKGRAFAADGHRIAVLHAPGQTESFPPLALTRASADAASKLIPNKGRIQVDPNGKAHIMSAKGALVSTLDLALFWPTKYEALPLIDNVFPFGKTPEPVRDACASFSLDAHDLADFDILLRAFGDDRDVVATVQRGADSLDPIGFTLGHWQVVQMPILTKERKNQ